MLNTSHHTNGFSKQWIQWDAELFWSECLSSEYVQINKGVDHMLLPIPIGHSTFLIVIANFSQCITCLPR